MRRAIGAVMLVFVIGLLSPALAAAKPLPSSTAVSISSSASTTLSWNELSDSFFKFNAWLEKTFGIDFFKLLGRIINLGIFLLKAIVNFLIGVLPKIQSSLPS